MYQTNIGVVDFRSVLLCFLFFDVTVVILKCLQYVCCDRSTLALPALSSLKGSAKHGVSVT